MKDSEKQIRTDKSLPTIRNINKRKEKLACIRKYNPDYNFSSRVSRMIDSDYDSLPDKYKTA